MDVPLNYLNAGWYKYGPKPGEKGNSVLDGHFGWKYNQSAIFDNLYLLKTDDYIRIIDSNNNNIDYRITKIVLYSINDSTKDIFISKDNKAHLILITCGGVWDNLNKIYLHRTVIFADLIE